MVMENEIRLGDILDKLTPSDRLVIYNAARQVVYRGFAANAMHSGLNEQRRIKKMGLGMETYRATEQMWDWEKTDSLPEQVPVEQFTQYRNDLEEDLLTQIFYMVTGSASYRRYTGSYSRRKKRGCDCTEVEAAEITLYFNFYKEELKREMKAFMAGFKFKNNLFPDENARCYQEHKGEERERTDEEKRMLKKAAFFAGFMDGKQPPRALIGEPEEED